MNLAPGVTNFNLNTSYGLARLFMLANIVNPSVSIVFTDVRRRLALDSLRRLDVMPSGGNPIIVHGKGAVAQTIPRQPPITKDPFDLGVTSTVSADTAAERHVRKRQKTANQAAASHAEPDIDMGHDDMDEDASEDDDKIDTIDWSDDENDTVMSQVTEMLLQEKQIAAQKKKLNYVNPDHLVQEYGALLKRCANLEEQVKAKTGEPSQ